MQAPIAGPAVVPYEQLKLYSPPRPGPSAEFETYREADNRPD